MPELMDRLFAKVEVNDSGCWIFTGAMTSAGYGSIALGKRSEGSESTHVVVWLLTEGEIPEGLELDHLCRVLLCCRPAHLEPVTRKMNIERGTRHSPTHCDNGHERTDSNTMLRPNGKRECRDCHNERQRERRQGCLI